jgi:hypothetical protein
VLGSAIAPPGSNLAYPVKKLIIEKLYEKIVFFYFMQLFLFDDFIRKMNCS